MAAERAMGPLIDVVKEAVLTAVREELAAQLTAVAEREREFVMVKQELEEVNGELAAVKGELGTVKGELGVLKREMAAVRVELAERGRASGVKGLNGKRKKIRQAGTEECAREVERGRKVLWMDRPRSMEKPASCEEGQTLQDLKLDVELQIRQSEGDRKRAWEQIKAASQSSFLHLSGNGLSNDMLAHASTMTQLTCIIVSHDSGFSAEGFKHLYRLTGLTSLVLLVANVTDAGLPHLTALSSLKELSLSGCEGVTNAGMVHVGRLTGLESLHLADTAVTDDVLQQLTALTKLTSLSPPEGYSLKNDAVRRRIAK
ncbi:unnamed protein product [Closterium sp. Yama58-4]|nr:unnamed protein product [Closterium sp. Yama58-4]